MDCFAGSPAVSERFWSNSLKEFVSGQTGNLADVFNFRALVLAAVLIVFTRYVKATKKLHPVFFILASAAVGVLLGF